MVWALNLAPVPVDKDGTRNSACAFVLVGLANHADADGTATFPSVRRLVRYTRLSERTVRTALDRLAEADIIRHCDPAIIAGRIRRADRRPQGWDLNLSLIRADLTDDDITDLERQFPGLRARVEAARAAQTDVSGEVQPLHPAPRQAVDNSPREVQQLHPATGTGCNQHTSGVQLTHERGAAIAPELSIEPSMSPPAAYARARDDPPVETRAGDGEVMDFFEALGPGWPLSPAHRDHLALAVSTALALGWQPGDLAAFVGANTAGVRSPYAVLAARLVPSELPAPPAPVPKRRPWCGKCDPDTRFLADDLGYPGDNPQRCPDCGPVARAGVSGMARSTESS